MGLGEGDSLPTPLLPRGVTHHSIGNKLIHWPEARGSLSCVLRPCEQGYWDLPARPQPDYKNENQL